MAALRVMISGTGLIGTSLGLALLRAGWHVTGWDPDPVALETAHRLGALSATSPDEQLDGFDLIVLAGPTSATLDTLPRMTTDAVVTDVAAVKAPIVKAGSHLRHFVAGHPMAGRAGSGAHLATPNLFRGAAWVLCGDDADEADVETVSQMAEAVGARPVLLAAAHHDRAVARISHLPHVLASALIETTSSDPSVMELAAGSFRDLTRVAGSDAPAWAEILASNASEVVAAIDALQGHLSAWSGALADGRATDIRAALERSQRTRLDMAPDTAIVAVPLVDEPGELARVGHALETSGADIRDIQLRHGEHGGGGLLTLTVHQRDESALRNGLTGEGFELD